MFTVIVVIMLIFVKYCVSINYYYKYYLSQKYGQLYNICIINNSKNDKKCKMLLNNYEHNTESALKIRPENIDLLDIYYYIICTQHEYEINKHNIVIDKLNNIRSISQDTRYYDMLIAIEYKMANDNSNALRLLIKLSKDRNFSDKHLIPCLIVQCRDKYQMDTLKQYESKCLELNNAKNDDYRN
jgi:hypothetical protein